MAHRFAHGHDSANGMRFVGGSAPLSWSPELLLETSVIPAQFGIHSLPTRSICCIDRRPDILT